ncbi:hypothetical protein LguiB_011223 [Lonicera macranthoides]
MVLRIGNDPYSFAYGVRISKEEDEGEKRQHTTASTYNHRYHDLVKNGDFVVYQSGSFIDGLLKSIGFDKSKLKTYNTSINYDYVQRQ